MAEESKAKRALAKVPGAHALSGGTDRMVAAQQERLEAQQRTIDSHEQTIRGLTNAVHSLEAHLPDVLNAIASHHGSQRRLRRELEANYERVDGLEEVAGGLSAEIDNLRSRLEFVRREVLFEAKYGSEAPPADTTAARSEVRILDEERVKELSADGARLNIGAGHIAMDGYINVDMRELPGIEVVAPVDSLPFERGTVAEIFSSHVLEHFPVEELRRKLLPQWVDLLRPGGVFRAVVPDADGMIAQYGAGEIPFEQFREVFFGGQEYEGDFHFNMFTTASLGELMFEAGLVDVVIEAEGRPNGLCLEFQMAGTRPK